MVGRSVYIYPRLHTSLLLLINEIYLKHASSSKLRLQEFKRLAKAIFDNHFFDEQVYQSIKSSSTRPKFLHIGLKFWARETKTETKKKVLSMLISDNFLRVFVRGVSI